MAKRRSQRFIRLMTALLITIAGICRAFAQSASPSDPPAGLAMGVALQSFFSDLEKKGLFSGAVYASRDGNIELLQGFGYSDRSDTIQITPDTAFKIGGLSKIFTAAFAVYLEGQGRLSLADPVVRYIPDYVAHNADKVTLHHLLTQTSGIPEYFTSWKAAWKMKFGEDAPPRGGTAEVLADIMQSEPRGDPGATYAPGNSGYMLLARAIERAAGEPYQNFIKEKLESLGLLRTGFDITRDVAIKERAVGRDLPSSLDPRAWLSRPRYRPVPYRHHEWDLAASGMYSTIRDLQVWDEIMSSDRFLTAEGRRRLFARHGRKTNGISYSYGWEINDTNGVPVIVQGGATQGFYSLMARVPERRVTLIVLSNRSTTAAIRQRLQREVISLIATQLNKSQSPM